MICHQFQNVHDTLPHRLVPTAEAAFSIQRQSQNLCAAVAMGHSAGRYRSQPTPRDSGTMPEGTPALQLVLMATQECHLAIGVPAVRRQLADCTMVETVTEVEATPTTSSSRSTVKESRV